MTCWRLLTNKNVSFDWSDTDKDNNNKTLTVTSAVANIRRHKTGHHYQQRNKMLTITPLTTILVYQQRKLLRDANGDNGNN